MGDGCGVVVFGDGCGRGIIVVVIYGYGGGGDGLGEGSGRLRLGVDGGFWGVQGEYCRLCGCVGRKVCIWRAWHWDCERWPGVGLVFFLGIVVEMWWWWFEGNVGWRLGWWQNRYFTGYN